MKGSLPLLMLVVIATFTACAPPPKEHDISPKHNNSTAIEHVLIVGTDTLSLTPIYDTIAWYELMKGDTVHRQSAFLRQLDVTDYDTIHLPGFLTYYDNDEGLMLDTSLASINHLVVSVFNKAVSAKVLAENIGSRFKLESSEGKYTIEEVRFEVYCKNGNCSSVGRGFLPHVNLELIQNIAALNDEEYLVLRYVRAKNNTGHNVHIHPQMCWKIETLP